MTRIFLKQNNENNEADNNIFWVTMSDLMLGLAIIFISLFVLAMAGFSQQTIRQKQSQINVSKQIQQELQTKNIDINIDKMTGDIKIPAVNLFDLNSSVLTVEGKNLLDKITPIYVNTIFSNDELTSKLEYIVVEGHTDSQMFAGVNSKNDQFLKNMDLSLDRANSVAEYILNSKYDKKYENSFRKKLVVEGKSFNDPVVVNGKEDFDKSRRVELKLKVKDMKFEEMFGFKTK